MNIIPQLAMLTTAAFLSSSGDQRQVDFKMTSPDGIQRLDQLWLVTYVDDAGREVVAQAKLTTGDYAPLIAADAARLESMMPAARGLAKANNITMRLVKFTRRLDVEEIRP
ncbi:hypothetical protein [Bradyrhizobium sp. JYMT SZCCT0428]|uniref:hypothetical protein n=1 Tax=Bradyrhizobium sp. JYMT SZCCT0428 TaxID=2807673 RepID=UPI001BABF1E5|nr:hypothetical protein [Bradyrhizobium sp. JYMT SZCCT0428]MBR1156267.1 hypothetical protein [Bradyrhizobium sp. JYMT SZCCT0428]